MSTNPVSVSLFCGAGGESLGKSLAFDSLGIKHEDVDTLAMNHWDLAIAVHGRNMPWIRVVRDDIEKVRATDFGIKRINLLHLCCRGQEW